MNKFTRTFESGRSVEMVGPIVTDDDRRALRADVEFTDGTVALLTYPSQVLAFFGTEPPRTLPIREGAYLAKGEAGDLNVLSPEMGDDYAAKAVAS